MEPGSGINASRVRTSAKRASVTQVNVGMLPRTSSNVCIFTPAFVLRKRAQGKTERQRSIVVASKA
jgi:hypothetical protein